MTDDPPDNGDDYDYLIGYVDPLDLEIPWMPGVTWRQAREIQENVYRRIEHKMLLGYWT